MLRNIENTTPSPNFAFLKTAELEHFNKHCYKINWYRIKHITAPSE